VKNQGIQINVDLLTFIYRRNLEEDLSILSDDIDKAKALRPTRITIFPNYYQLLSQEAVKNPEHHGRDVEAVFYKIRKLRELIQSKEDAYYKDISPVKGEPTLGNYRINYYLTSPEYTSIQYNCTDPKAEDVWGNTEVADEIRHQCVLAFGGFRDRRPTSYIKDKLSYVNIVSEGFVSYSGYYANVSYPKDSK
jgi:hypothetical protein